MLTQPPEAPHPASISRLTDMDEDGLRVARCALGRELNAARWKHLPHAAFVNTIKLCYYAFVLYVFIAPSALAATLLGDAWLWLFVIIMPASYLLLRHVPEPTFRRARALGYDHWEAVVCEYEALAVTMDLTLDFRWHTRVRRGWFGQTQFESRAPVA